MRQVRRRTSTYNKFLTGKLVLESVIVKAGLGKQEIGRSELEKRGFSLGVKA